MLSNSFVFVARPLFSPAWADDRPSARRFLGFALGSIVAHALMVGAMVQSAQNVASEISRPPELLSERLQFVGETFDVDAEESRDGPSASAAIEAKALEREVPEKDAPSSEKPVDDARSDSARDDDARSDSARGDAAHAQPPATPPLARDTSTARTKPIESAPPRSTSGGARTSPGEQSHSGAPSAPGNFGEAGQEAPTVQLRRAFVKTLPLAARGDPAWLELPLGSKFDGAFVLHVSDAGVLDEITALGAADDALSRAVLKNRLFLRAGRFAVREAGRAELRLRIRARIEQHEPLGAADSSDSDGAVLVTAIGMRIDPSSKSAPPTGAYFTYGSGRHVEFEVSEMAP